LVEEIVLRLKPLGPFNIQLIRTDKDELKIFEINPRFSTTSILEIAGGLDLIDLYISHYNSEVKLETRYPKEGLVLHRRWESLFYEV